MQVESFRIAAVQATPVFIDREATVDKACHLIAEAGHSGARLVAFPEAFIPSYPDWVWAVPAGDDGTLGEMYGEYLAHSVDIPGAATERLCAAAKEAGVYVVMGVSERNVEASGTSLYNTLLYIDPQGEIMGKHRKLVPTAGERLVWAQGDGSTLAVYDTPYGKLGGLICWENYMPLARYAMYAWGVQIYVAATWARGEPWLATLRHIACEGRVYVLGSCIALRMADIPDRYAFKSKYYSTQNEDAWINVGDSAIVGPNGEFLAGPASMKEEILYADVDPGKMGGPRWLLDVAGHYGRPDVFQLTVNTGARPMLRVTEDLPAADGAISPAVDWP